MDIFINYDCDLHAANLYERTAHTLSDLAILGDPRAPAGQGSRVRDAAIVCCMSMLSSLDAWAGEASSLPPGTKLLCSLFSLP